MNVADFFALGGPLASVVGDGYRHRPEQVRLADEVRTTFANGFTGFWLPRDIDGTLRVTYGGKSGETAISTAAKAPTCLTTLRLT